MLADCLENIGCWGKLVVRDLVSNLLARLNGAPVVRSFTDSSTGFLVRERRVGGRLESDDDAPAVEELDPITARPVRHMFFHKGKLHCLNKPAYIEYSAKTGAVVLEVFCRDGQLFHQPDGVAAIDYAPETGKRLAYDLSRPGAPPIIW